MKFRIIKLILIGLLIRFLIIPFFAHPDFFWINWEPYFLSKHKVFNVYRHFGDEKGITLFKYPPLSYYVLGTNIGLFNNILPGLSLFEKITDPHNWTEWFSSRSIFRELFVLKLIFLLSDIIILLLLLKIVIKPEKKISLVKYWAFNPLIIYSVYMYAQFDIIAVLFIVLSIYFYDKNKFLLSGLSLGIGGMIKHFPFLLLPFLVLVSNVKFYKKILILILSLIPYILLSLPFLSSESFINDVLFNSFSYLTTKIDTGLLPFFIIIILSIILLIKISKKDTIKLNRIYLVVFILYFLVTKFHPQFIIWVVPMLILELIFTNKIKTIYFFTIIFYFIYTFHWGRNTSSVMLYPLNNILYGLPSPKSIINYYFNIDGVLDYSRYIFCLLCFIIIFRRKYYEK